MTLSLLLRKRPKSKSPEGRTLFRKHLSGFFGRPMPADRGWIIGNPKTAERQQRGIAFENICLHLVERVSCRMAYQRVIRGILKRRYAGNAGQDECVSIRIRQISVARPYCGHIGNGVDEILKWRRELVVATEEIFCDGTVSPVQNECAKNTICLGLVLLDVSPGTEQTLLLPGEENDADGAVGFHPGRNNGLGCSQNGGGGAKTIVNGAGTQVPRVQVSAENDNLFRLLRPWNFTNNIVGNYRTRSE